MTLYEIQSDLALLLAAIEETDGEITEAQEAALDALNLSRDEKLANWCRYYVNMSIEQTAIAQEINRLQGKVERIEKRGESTLARLGALLGVGNKWRDAIFSLSWRKSERVEIRVRTDQLPERFLRFKEWREVDKIAIRDAIKAGETVEGAELVETHSLQVK